MEGLINFKKKIFSPGDHRPKFGERTLSMQEGGGGGGGGVLKFF